MNDVKTKSLERKFKSLIPAQLKMFFQDILAHSLIGHLLKSSGIKYNCFGGIFDYKNVSNTEAARIFWGIWESAEIRFAKRFANTGTIVELGSSVGVTLGVLANHRVNTRFISIEASPVNYEKLIKLKCLLPENGNEYVFLNSAIAYGLKRVYFNHTSTTGSKVTDGNESCNESVSVPAITLSGILEGYNVADGFTLITDIEGAEADIFFEDKNALASCKTIIAELEDTISYSIDDQISKLISLNFHVLERYGNVVVLTR